MSAESEGVGTHDEHDRQVPEQADGDNRLAFDCHIKGSMGTLICP